MADEIKRDKDDVIYKFLRKSPRVDAEIEVSFEVSEGGPHNFYTGITQDISQGGVFLATHRVLPVGSKLRITFTLQGREITADAEVVWTRTLEAIGPGVEPGMGMKFVNISKEDEAFIAAYVADRETIYYDGDQ